MILDRKLTNEEQINVLDKLLGFSLHNIDDDLNEEPEYSIIDEEGYEFYGIDSNLKYDLTTLGGIIKYIIDKSKKEGYSDCQMDFKKLLGI